jgi:hypothetical protein
VPLGKVLSAGRAGVLRDLGPYNAPGRASLTFLSYLPSAAYALRPRSVFVFSNEIPIDIKSVKASAVRV